MKDIEDAAEKLLSQEPQKRLEALNIIAERPSEESLLMVLPLLSDPVARVRSMAVYVLGAINDSQAIPYILQFCRQEADREARGRGFQALDEYQDERIATFLIEQAHSKREWRFERQEIARQLRHYDSEAAVEVLLSLLNDEDAYVEQFAAESLFVLNRESLRPVWEHLLIEIHPPVQKVAARALAQLG